jgi:hypothetical protein
LENAGDSVLSALLQLVTATIFRSAGVVVKYFLQGIADLALRLAQRNKNPVVKANPHAGFLDFNLVSSLGEAVSRQLSAIS